MKKKYPSFQFANNSLAGDQRIGFNFFQTDSQVFDFDLQRLFDGFDLDNAFLFLMQDIQSMFKFTLGLLRTIVSQLQLQMFKLYVRINIGR